MRRFNYSPPFPFFIFIVTCFVGYFLFFSWLFAKHLLRAPEDYIYDEQKFYDQELYDLEVKALFWQNKIEAAQEDSIIMTINLQDSIVTLDLLGIELRSCRIYHYRLNRALSRLKKSNALKYLLNSVLELKEVQANICLLYTSDACLLYTSPSPRDRS